MRIGEADGRAVGLDVMVVDDTAARALDAEEIGMHADDRRGVIARIEQDGFLDQVLRRHGRAMSVQRPLG